MMKTHVLTASMAVFLCVFSNTAHALVQPQGSKLDPRVQTVTYNKQNVINITAKVGHAVLVQFEDDERLEGDSASLGMGDAEGWNLSVKGNNILFKPMVDQSDTNLIVTTNKRTYVFQLQIDNTKTPTYVLRFIYPDSISKQQTAELEKQRKAENTLIDAITPLSATIKNKNYWGFGDKELSPSSLFDDGTFTYFVFNNNKDLPVIYRKNPDGTESLVNKHIKNNTVIVQELNKNFVLRLGQSVLGIENRGFNENAPAPVRTGTTMDETVRVNKEKAK